MRDNKSKTGVGQNLRQLRMEKKKRKKKRLITFAILEVLTLILIFSYAYVLRITREQEKDGRLFDLCSFWSRLKKFSSRKRE